MKYKVLLLVLVLKLPLQTLVQPTHYQVLLPQLNSKLGRTYFPMQKPQTKPSITFSQLLLNQDQIQYATKPNQTFNPTLWKTTEKRSKWKMTKINQNKKIKNGRRKNKIKNGTIQTSLNLSSSRQ